MRQTYAVEIETPESGRTGRTRTLRLYRAEGVWHCQAMDEETRREWGELFGGADTLPTPYGAEMPAELVRQEIQRRKLRAGVSADRTEERS